jgi:hypothetical protein
MKLARISAVALLGIVLVSTIACSSSSSSQELITYCAANCQTNWLGDGTCQNACNKAACDYDNGDCSGNNQASVTTYRLNTSWNEPQCSVSPESGDYTAGSTVTLTALPGAGWKFDQWTIYSYRDGAVNGSVTATTNPLTITMNCQKLAHAYFERGSSSPTPTHTPATKPSSGGTCFTGCPLDWLGDGECDSACNIMACNYDDGDCPTPTYLPTRTPTPTSTHSSCSAGYSPAVNNPIICCQNGYPYYWSSDRKCHTTSGTASTPTPTPNTMWRENIRSGDIVLNPSGAWGWGHVGICYGTSYVIEAISGGVNKSPIEKWDDIPGIYVLRVDCNNSVASAAASLALTQLGKPYQLYITDKSDSMNSSTWYCSELVWAVYRHQGIDLEYTPDTWGLIIGAVTPWEVYMSTQVIYHYGPPDIIPD